MIHMIHRISPRFGNNLKVNPKVSNFYISGLSVLFKVALPAYDFKYSTLTLQCLKHILLKKY